MPARYEAVARLGQGGGGEVWSVTDRVTGEALAFKILAEDAGEAEVMALVREAATLSGLEGLGVPRVVAFGSVPGTKRRFLVRELVEGQSLEDVLESGRGPWLEPLVRAADQLTVLHRAGLLHGDIKPANVIVGKDGTGTLVDLGLAAPWKEGGTRARGLTPKYAAPELLLGEPLTVRAEIYALGATLRDAIAARGDEIDDEMRTQLARIAARATEEAPHARYPSADELASALKRAAHLESDHFEDAAAWPVLGLDLAAQRLTGDVALLAPGEGLAIEGPARSGRTTLLRRLSWALAVSGVPVANVAPANGRHATKDVVKWELEAWSDTAQQPVIVIDDLDELDRHSVDVLARAVQKGARVVAVGSADDLKALVKERIDTFAIPPLDDISARELLGRSVPSLPDRLVDHLLSRTERRPGDLRTFVKRIGARPVTSIDEVEELLSHSRASRPPLSTSREDVRRELERALDTGRFDSAAEALGRLGPASNDDESVAFAIASAKILLARGDSQAAANALDAVQNKSSRAWLVTRARASTRLGDYARAWEEASKAAGDDALGADALAVKGVALAYTGDDAGAIPALNRAVEIAQSVHDTRITAVALGSLAIAHQKAGRVREARDAYTQALGAAEQARDAWSLATTRLNLAGLAKNDSDLAQSLVHLEAALDMGRRAGSPVVVQQALFNLANLDLYLGRYARAASSIDGLAQQRDKLTPNARAQLLGLQAELASRMGEIDKSARLYESCAAAYDAVGRPTDATEARLEGILTRLSSGDSAPDPTVLGRELDALRTADLGEHDALASIVRGSIALARGDENGARSALDNAHERAVATGQREWAWRALDARARLASSQGSSSLARRDTDAALAMLEEVAQKLPRDLREVFWNDPRRRAIRQAHTATLPANGHHQQALTAMPFKTRTDRKTNMTVSLPEPDRLAMIFEITRDLARERNLERLLQSVTDHAVGLLGGERGLIVLVDDEGNVVTHTARTSKGEEAAQNFSRSVAERVIREGEPVIAASARDDERLAEAVSVHQLMIQSIACVPIRGAPPAGKTIGALYVETRLRPGLRFREELPTLVAFADQAAIAIESARLLDENQKRAEELARANEDLRAAQDRLAEALERRTEQLQTARRDLKQVRTELRSHFGYGGLVGTSAAMRKIYALIDRIKDTDVPVLVTGENGTGKELVAKAVHQSGPRGKQPFLGVNCGAIPENLLESELFGHVRGAFTGAERDRKGLFREAENGTIMLDEIGEMPMKMQAGLLRVLQEKTVRPVGGIKEEPCSARVIAATNRDLSQMVAAGLFREDLFYRIQVVELRVPSLRERAEDVPALIDHFLGIFAARHKRERKTIERNAVRRLQSYDWPGNVRQLEHVLLNAWLLSEGNEIEIEDFDLPSASSRISVPPPSPQAAAAAPRARSKEEHKESEKEQILAALERSNWNRVQAAKLVGLPRRTFYRRLKDYGII